MPKARRRKKRILLSEKMAVRETLREKKDAVDSALESLLAGGTSPLHDAMRYGVLSGGKRFRPLLLLSSGEAFGAPRDVLLPYACALELIHNYSLIHDDLPSMDNDDFRRGMLTCHKAFGEGTALLAGDALLTLAFDVLALAPFPDGFYGRKDRAVREISRAAGVHGMILGQWMDIGVPPAAMTRDVYLTTILKKTGGLIIAAVKAGALLGGADDTGLEALEDYGRSVGLAFQLRDDVQDADAERAKISSVRPNSVALFGLEESRRMIEEHVRRALGALDRIPLDSPELRALAGRLSLRNGKENE
jgi:geranylgeranyl diphosphate synthase type II